MVVHIFPYKLYTRGFVDFTRAMYPAGEHTFIIYGRCPNKDFEVLPQSGVFLTESPNSILKEHELTKLADHADKLIIHSNNLLVCKMFIRRPLWLKKSYLVFWGFDLYCYREPAKGWKQKAWRTIQKSQIRRAKAVCVLTDREKEVIDTLIPRIRGKKMRAMYMISAKKDQLQATIDYHKPSAPYRITVGNSASETNCHIEILNKLTAYKEEDIRVYCPLTYGSEEYRTQVIELGKELFGERFIPMTEMMPYEEYYRFTNTCSVGLFNNDRQQAMGNISMLLEQGGKVFLRTDTPMWERFTDLGYRVYDIAKVGSISFHDFLLLSDEDKKWNTEIAIKRNSMEGAKEVWDRIYSD